MWQNDDTDYVTKYIKNIDIEKYFDFKMVQFFYKIFY